MRAKLFKSPFFSEGVFFFFPICAIYAALMPLIYVVGYGLSFPASDYIVPQQWHGHEMIFGFFSSALAGFLTSAVAEWTDTKPVHGKALFLLFILWLPARLIGLFGVDHLMIVASFFDFSFLILLLFLILKPIIKKRQTRAVSFAIWLIILIIVEFCLKWAWWHEDVLLASRALNSEILVFVILFSLSLSRIHIVVVNLALDPSGKSSPYRPHPGRRNLAAFLTAFYGVVAFFLPDSMMQYYLAFAAAAAFFDRLAEWFIGRAVFKTEILCLFMANLSAGLGLLLIGLSGFYPSISPYLGLHVLTILTLGLAVIAVLIIAGLRHSGRDLTIIPWQAKLSIWAICLAGIMRVLPQLIDGFPFAHYQYMMSSLFWSAAFILWLFAYVPLLRHPLHHH
ncbi:NnrS family protein [Bartonella sp. HY761]|uniref:NnrS family protein n=1 Tax=Bartonella sp. HY761 TaxID=2979330 RepID=UPI0021FE079E|nr:NnrS family protein [Bartonella sp. HY761]UXN06579.1 NnrS family protein [Bartonella sp. HY761]